MALIQLAPFTEGALTKSHELIGYQALTIEVQGGRDQPPLVDPCARGESAAALQDIIGEPEGRSTPGWLDGIEVFGRGLLEMNQKPLERLLEDDVLAP